jgi:phage virion morphogenesis protein
MAGTEIRMESNAAEVANFFAAFAQRVDDLEPFWLDVAEYLQLSHRYRFELAISPDGQPWEPLDPDYQRRKKRNASEILVLDAFLRDQLAGEATPEGLEFGTNRIYAATHQFGDPDRGIPQREFLGISDDDEGEILRLAQEHLESVIQSTASDRL